MAIYKTTCPHCHTSSVAFESAQEWEVPGDNSRRGLFICGHCSEGIVISFLPGINAALSQLRDLSSANAIIYEMWPSLIETDAPADTPERPALYFKQAAESLRAGHFDASGMMFRKCLESATKAVCTDAASDALVKRIERLAATGIVTSDLKDWAHQIRLSGNTAAHEDQPFSKEEAERLAAFSDAFLRYLFTLPALVRKGTELSDSSD